MKPFTKREITLTVAALVIAVIAAVYIVNLQHTQSTRNENNNAALATKDAQLSELTNYNATICGEYRKLYSAYKEAVAQTPPVNAFGYALPGSAKGDVDECYRPE
jgi:hypothetical protein